MNGRIWAESATGGGSVFHFTVLAQSAPAFQPIELHVNSENMQGRRVLIVDDGETNRLILRIQAQRWGMIPHEAKSGLEALAWLAGNIRADVAILDMQMPNMDGLDLAARIHQLPACKDLPLILLSSAMALRDKSDPRWDNFATCFTKPVKQSQLRDSLLLALDKKVRITKETTHPLPLKNLA